MHYKITVKNVIQRMHKINASAVFLYLSYTIYKLCCNNLPFALKFIPQIKDHTIVRKISQIFYTCNAVLQQAAEQPQQLKLP